MSKKQIKIKENVMEKIAENKISMKPKSYFILGSILTFVGLIASVISSIFFISIITFMLRAHGPMVNYRFAVLISSFPLWIPLLAVFCLILGILLIKKYDISYKFNFWILSIVFLFIIILSGIIIDSMELNNLFINRGPMNGIMREYIKKNNLNNPNRLNQPGALHDRMQNNGYGRINR